MVGDPHYNNVSLLLHMTGADNSSVFVDSSKNSYTQAPSSSAKIIQSQADPFGISNGVGYFSGDGLQLAAPAVAWPSGSEDATLELYVRPENTGTTRVLLNRDTTGFNFEIQAGGLLGLYFYGPDTYISGGSVPNLAWSHVAFSRQGNTFRLFVNGQIVATATQAISFNGASFFIGSTHQGTLPYKGCMSVLRITKGMARYTENFTPPTAPFPDYVALISGTVKNASNAPAARLIRAMREDTGALSGYATSDATTGAYTIKCSSDGAHSLIAYPPAGEDLPALTLRGVMPV